MVEGGRFNVPEQLMISYCTQTYMVYDLLTL